MIPSRRFLAVALLVVLAVQWQAAVAFSFSRLQSRTTTTTSLWSTTEKSSATTGAGQEVILNQDKFIEEMEAAIPHLGVSEKPATSKWEEAEHRLAALATKGRALQQKYAVEISELRTKGVHDDFPDRVPLSNAAVWREEPDVPVSAKGGVKAKASAVTSEGGNGMALAGVALLAGAAFVVTLTEPAMVSEALSRIEIPVSIVEELQATLGQAQV